MKKELLNYKITKGKIIPNFINANDPNLLEFANSLIKIGSNSIGLTKAEIDIELNSAANLFHIDDIIKKGLISIIFDRFYFESSFEGDISELRNKVFILSSQKISEIEENSYEIYKDKICKILDINKDNLENILYSDLPELNKASKFKIVEATELLNRYNIYLIKGFLFFCESIQIKIPNQNVLKSDLRYLLKQIKFYQLSSQITMNNNFIEISLDGPMSMFLNTHKYGMNLASFFPALILLSKWELTAQIELGKSSRKKGILNLNQDAALISYYKTYSSYIPEDFLLFENNFIEKSNDWKISSEFDDILFDGVNYFFPDYKFLLENKKIVYLELFHSWHKHNLKIRLVNMNKNNSILLIIGVAKNLLKDPEIKNLLDANLNIDSKVFIFRELPTVTQVLQKLSLF
ncbi:DUF790 family protein [Silvanigrella aquatica]|uniref:DUF790 family protein n=1 Tax=Silvanigrella aquatica TaxID=1915309 RepID=A0A1L4D0L1_9BACT|nr:DUF790 family protein [Silvanigrella aquatica]APJ03753.1 hypothetical protein AXG55_07470 [Silvanigrella aquatica]